MRVAAASSTVRKMRYHRLDSTIAEPQPTINPAGVRAPDISSLSPQERADRLYNRVMLLATQGKVDSVQFFAPMALTAYQMLSPLNADQRYDMGRIGEVAGALPLAKAQADSILRENPNHLLGLILEARIATLAGDTAQLHSYERRLVAAEKSELAKKRDEYVRHEDDITNALAAGTQESWNKIMTSPNTIHLAHSPDSDDAFMFYALADGQIDTQGISYVHELQDIETLNGRAHARRARCDGGLDPRLRLSLGSVRAAAPRSIDGRWLRTDARRASDR